VRIAATIYIILAIAANFVFDNPTSFALAILSYPALVWVLLSRKKRSEQNHKSKNEDKEEQR
jgi:hypothetical protein